MLEHIKLERFTAFEKLSLRFSQGLNVIIGENGCGKTHLLKLVYAACDISTSQKGFAEKINRVFLPSGEQIGRLVKRRTGSSTGSVEVVRIVQVDGQPKSIALRLSMSNHTKEPSKATVSGAYKQWQEHPLTSVYVPVKDMMANAPGFRSLYSLRHIHFEEVYPSAPTLEKSHVGPPISPTSRKPPQTALSSSTTQWFNCPQAFSSRLTLTGCGVRSSCAKKLTRNSSSSQRNSCMRASCAPLRSATRRQ